MNVPVRYERALTLFQSMLNRHEAVIEAAILYGSLARGTVRDGHSDILDAVIVFDATLLTDRGFHSGVLEAMVACCRSLSTLGVPFHPFHYVYSSMDTWWCMRIYLPSWQSASKILVGRDNRRQLGTSDEDHTFAQGAFFAAERRRARQFAWLVSVPAGERRREDVLGLLRWCLRDIPQLACLASGFSVDRADAVPLLSQLFPGAPLSLLAIPLDALTSWSQGSLFRLTSALMATHDALHTAVKGRISPGHTVGHSVHGLPSTLDRPGVEI